MPLFASEYAEQPEQTARSYSHFVPVYNLPDALPQHLSIRSGLAAPQHVLAAS